MNSKVEIFTRNLSYSFIANIVSLFTSSLLILIVPAFIGINDYGYWQLYIFYTSFIAYMSLGLTDGAYLRYGGYEYSELQKPVYVSQYWFLVLFDSVVCLAIVLYFLFFSTDAAKTLVIFLACITGILIVPRSLLTFMLQATNRIREYSIILIIERIMYFILTIILLIIGIENFEYIILADVFGKFCSLIYSYFVCKELVFGKFESVRNSFKEIYVNISVGSKLMFAYLANMLIIGIVRFFIEKNWSIETFGKVSFTLSISNMFLIFINSLGVMLFPALRRLSIENLPSIYKKIRTIIGLPLLGFLIIYFPIKEILVIWLPQYKESLDYMAFIFPMFIYESKMNLLINTYLKTLRKEKLMLAINLITVVITLIYTYVTVIILDNLYLTILSIVILLGLRCVIAEIILSKLLNVKFKKDIIIESVITIIFIFTSWYLSTFIGFIIYLIIYLIYLIIKKNDITSSFKIDIINKYFTK